jgi:hypothetical protein
MAKKKLPRPGARITSNAIRWSRKWNWDGDRILHEEIVPSSRPPIGRKSGAYDIDVREFLVTERNAVMRRTLEKDIHTFISNTPKASLALFTSRRSGSFDHRADMIAAYVGDKIAYRYGGKYDPWQFPDETLKLGEGDCEDRALLIASLLLASGISSFNVRVALGQFSTIFESGKREVLGHCWVMYKNEAGQWLILEPTHADVILGRSLRADAPKPVYAEYHPVYLFNDVHLWAVGDAAKPNADKPNLKRDWSRVHPEFAGHVHKSILNDALKTVQCPQWVIDKLNRNFTTILGNPKLTVDAVDLNPFSYDPRDHFDNAYIDDSWGRLQQNLDKFKKDPLANLDEFFHAAHAIADFYAHSSYAHFAATKGTTQIPLYDPKNPTPNKPADYGAGSDFDLTLTKFTQNSALWTGTPVQAAAQWKDQIISGRYAQHKDTHSIPEGLASIPHALKIRSDFKKRGSLPHHNEIAVDEEKMGRKHVLYEKEQYPEQYAIRLDAAARQIAQEFKARW